VIDARSDKNPVLLATTPAGQATRRLDNMRLLVVEDNHNNQQVARELLEDEGALVQIAQHGQEGVYAVANANPPFDVVLMDLQMPVMDGFTATRHIRTVLGMTTLPIVAMTANAMASDREACLAAGMNDHVGKPFDLNSLVRVLRQQAHWTDLDKNPEEATPALALGVTDTAARLGIDLAGALGRLGGKHALYQRMLSTFVRDLGDMPEQLQGFAHAGLTQEAKRMLHTLKGLAATLGATDLAAQAAQCEKHLADDANPAGSAEALASSVQQACNAIAHATPGLQGLVDALQAAQAQPLAQACDPATAPTPINAVALGIAATSLQNLLREGNMDAMQSMAELQQRFGDALGDTLNPLSEAMAELDFEAALSHCAALIESWNA
jgi:two-component system sensor histidine kinase/response regulator